MSNDPQLLELANALQHVDFGVDPSDRFTMYDHPMRNVTMFPNRPLFRVRFYLKGANRTIGITPCGVSAMRFADMARVHFWRFRQRDVRPPTDADMNYSVDLAKSDLSHNAPAVGLLDAMAKLLNLAYYEEQPREQRRTVHSEVKQFLHETAAEASVLEQRLAAMEKLLLEAAKERVELRHMISQLILSPVRVFPDLWCPPHPDSDMFPPFSPQGPGDYPFCPGTTRTTT